MPRLDRISINGSAIVVMAVTFAALSFVAFTTTALSATTFTTNAGHRLRQYHLRWPGHNRQWLHGHYQRPAFLQ